MPENALWAAGALSGAASGCPRRKRPSGALPPNDAAADAPLLGAQQAPGAPPNQLAALPAPIRSSWLGTNATDAPRWLAGRPQFDSSEPLEVVYKVLHEVAATAALDCTVQQAKRLSEGRWAGRLRLDALPPAASSAPAPSGLVSSPTLHITASAWLFLCRAPPRLCGRADQPPSAELHLVMRAAAAARAGALLLAEQLGLAGGRCGGRRRRAAGATAAWSAQVPHLAGRRAPATLLAPARAARSAQPAAGLRFVGRGDAA